MDGLRPTPLREQRDSADAQVAGAAALLAHLRPPPDAPDSKVRVRREVMRRLDEPRRVRALRPALALGLLALGGTAAASVTWAVVTWVRTEKAPAVETPALPAKARAVAPRPRGGRGAAEAPADDAIPTPGSVALGAELPAPAPVEGLGALGAEAGVALPALGAAPAAPPLRTAPPSPAPRPAPSAADDDEPAARPASGRLARADAPAAVEPAAPASALPSPPEVRPVAPALEAAPPAAAPPPERSPPPVAAPPAAPALAQDPEVALLQSAYDALRREDSPARAARLAEQYLGRYPGGTLAEEALGLAVEAYALLDDGRAGAHARTYLRLYPAGRFLRAVRRAAARFPD